MVLSVTHYRIRVTDTEGTEKLQKKFIRWLSGDRLCLSGDEVLPETCKETYV